MPAQGLVGRFRNIRDAIPAYVPFGAGSRRQAEERQTRAKRLHRREGQNWDFRQSFTDDELRLILSDGNFSREVLKAYDPSFKTRDPSPQDVSRFRQSVATSEGRRVYPSVERGRLPQIGERHGINLDQAQRAREGFQAKLAENNQLEHQARSILQNAERVAPLNDLHTTARGMLQQNNNPQSMQLAIDEIAAARNTNIPREIAPYLARASQTPDAYLRRYMDNYRPLLRNFREEARKDFLEHDLPTINNHFASRGAFYSSAREAALRKAIADKDARITRESRNLNAQALEHGMRDFNAERGHHLRQAEVAGHAHGAQREANIRAAEALRINSLSQQEAARQQAAALSNMGSIEQRQREREIEVARQAHEESQERPWLEAMREAALLGQLPPGTFPPNTLSTASTLPPPPNPYAAVGGALAHATGMAMQPHFQQQQGYSSFFEGGHVRNAYAQGDSVARAAAEVARMKEHTENSPEETEMRQRASEYRNYRANPQADYLFSLGNHMLGNLQDDPMKTFAQGSNLGMQASKSAQAHNLSLQERENNLLDKVNSTKMYMQDFLSRHHSSMKQYDEMLRHHQATEGESKRYHDIMQEMATEKTKNGSINKKKTAAERNIENDAIKDLQDSKALTNDLSKMDKLLKKKWTGRFVGAGKEMLGVDDAVSKLGNDIVVKAQQSLSNIRGSQYLMELLKSTKPGLTSSKEANNLLISSLTNGANDARDKSIIKLLDLGWTPEKIKKRFKIDVPAHLLEEPTEQGQGMETLPQAEEPMQEAIQQQQADMVKIIAPDGEPWLIPQGNVEAALQDGGQLAQ
jgi:hypothetical protein